MFHTYIRAASGNRVDIDRASFLMDRELFETAIEAMRLERDTCPRPDPSYGAQWVWDYLLRAAPRAIWRAVRARRQSQVGPLAVTAGEASSTVAWIDAGALLAIPVVGIDHVVAAALSAAAALLSAVGIGCDQKLGSLSCCIFTFLLRAGPPSISIARRS